MLALHTSTAAATTAQGAAACPPELAISVAPSGLLSVELFAAQCGNVTYGGGSASRECQIGWLHSSFAGLLVAAAAALAVILLLMLQ